MKLGMESTALDNIQQQHQGLELLQPLDIEGVKNRIGMVQYVASILKEGVDFGHIPGTRGNAKSLLKPGADKFRMALNIPFRMIEIESLEDLTRRRNPGKARAGIRCESFATGFVSSTNAAARSKARSLDP